MKAAVTTILLSLVLLALGNGDDSWSTLVLGLGRVYEVATSTGSGTRTDILTACYTPDIDNTVTAELGARLNLIDITTDRLSSVAKIIIQ